MKNRLFVMATFTVALLSLACGGDTPSTPSPIPTSTPTPTPQTVFAETAELPPEMRQFAIKNAVEFGGRNMRWPDGKIVRARGYDGMPAGALEKVLQFYNDHIPAESGVHYRLALSGEAVEFRVVKEEPNVVGCGTVVRQIGSDGVLVGMTVKLAYGIRTNGSCQSSWEGHFVGTLAHEAGHGHLFGLVHPTEAEMEWSIANTVPFGVSGESVAGYDIPSSPGFRTFMRWSYTQKAGATVR